MPAAETRLSAEATNRGDRQSLRIDQIKVATATCRDEDEAKLRIVAQIVEANPARTSRQWNRDRLNRIGISLRTTTADDNQRNEHAQQTNLASHFLSSIPKRPQ